MIIAKIAPNLYNTNDTKFTKRCGRVYLFFVLKKVLVMRPAANQPTFLICILSFSFA